MAFQSIREMFEAVSKSPTYGIIRRILPALVLAIALAVMIRFVGREYSTIRSEVISLQWPFLAMAVVTSVVSTVFGGIVWFWAIRSLHGKIGLADAIRAWCLATPGKYGLGAIGQYVGRIYVAERVGLGRTIILGSLVVELAVIGISGSGVMLLLSPFAAAFLLPHPPRFLIYMAILAAILVIGCWPYLVEHGAPIIRFKALRFDSPPTVRELHWATGAMVVDWFLFGATVFFVARSMAATGPALYPFFVFSTTVSILLGFVGFTPMGLGVRDVTMAFLLSQAIPSSEAAVAVVLHRLATAVAELACAGLALCVQRGRIPFLRASRTLS